MRARDMGTLYFVLTTSLNDDGEGSAVGNNHGG